MDLKYFIIPTLFLLLFLPASVLAPHVPQHPPPDDPCIPPPNPVIADEDEPQEPFLDPFSSRAVIVSWTMVFSLGNADVTNFIIEHSTDGVNFVQLENKIRDFESASIAKGKTIEIFYFLHQTPLDNAINYYRITPESICKIHTEDTVTNSVFVKHIEGVTFIAKGDLIKNRSLDPEEAPTQAFVLGLVQSSRSPDNEIFDFRLSPVPPPLDNQLTCFQHVDLHWKKSRSGGQNIVSIVSLFDNSTDTVIRTEDFSAIMGNREHNFSLILNNDETNLIQDYEQLFVRITINGLVPDDPPNQRALQIFEVFFFVHESEWACPN